MPRRGRRKKKRISVGKYRKNARREIVLQEEEIRYLVEKTAFNASEISEWFK